MKHLRTLLLIGLMAGVLAGCEDDDGDTGSEDSGSSQTETPTDTADTQSTEKINTHTTMHLTLREGKTSGNPVLQGVSVDFYYRYHRNGHTWPVELTCGLSRMTDASGVAKSDQVNFSNVDPNSDGYMWFIVYAHKIGYKYLEYTCRRIPINKSWEYSPTLYMEKIE